MPNQNDYSAILRHSVASPEARQRGDDLVIAPYENAVAELDDLIGKLDADAGDSAMNDLRQLVLNDTHVPAATVAKLVELLVKDLLHIKHRLEKSNANYRKKRNGAGGQTAETTETTA